LARVHAKQDKSKSKRNNQVLFEFIHQGENSTFSKTFMTKKIIHKGGDYRGGINLKVKKEIV